MTAPTPSKWNETVQLTILRNAEKAMASEPKDFATLDSIFNALPPAFEWTEHATHLQDLRSQWNRLSKVRLDEAVVAAEAAISDYVTWLYQVQNPVTGAYRRYKVAMPEVSFTLPATADASTNRERELKAQLRRLKAWETAEALLKTDQGHPSKTRCQ